MGRLRELAGRHEPRVWVMWAVGAVLLVLTPVAVVDPAIWLLLADPELVAVLGFVGLALLRVRAFGFLLRVVTALAFRG